jgi:hypothetical protein
VIEAEPTEIDSKPSMREEEKEREREREATGGRRPTGQRR